MFVAAKCQLFNTSLQCKLKSIDSRKAKGFVILKIIYNILNTVRKCKIFTVLSNSRNIICCANFTENTLLEKYTVLTTG